MEKRSKKIFKITGFALLAMFTVATVAVGCGRSFHRNPDPEKIKKYVLWKVNDRLDDLDANDYQRKAIVDVTKDILADVVKMKEKHKDKSEKLEIITELERGKPDSAKYHKLLDERINELRDFAHRTLDKTLRAFMTLDGEQRRELMEEVREHIEEHHSS